MFTIIGGDGKEYGPVTLEQLRTWIGDGRANLESQAKRTDDEQWRRIGDFPEFSGAEEMPPPPAPHSLPETTGPITVDPKTYADDLIARASKLGVVDCLDRSWNLLKSDFWPIIGATLVLFVVLMAASAVPILGLLVSLLLTGVFYGGLFSYYLKKIRGQPGEFADIFSGFSLAFMPLMVATLVSQLLVTLGVLLLILPGIYLAVAYVFTYLLIMDKRMDFWSAMEVSRRVITSQWWRVFGLLLLGTLLCLLGLVGLIIGIFITIPIYVGGIVYAYEELCNPPPRK